MQPEFMGDGGGRFYVSGIIIKNRCYGSLRVRDVKGKAHIFTGQTAGRYHPINGSTSSFSIIFQCAASPWRSLLRWLTYP